MFIRHFISLVFAVCCFFTCFQELHSYYLNQTTGTFASYRKYLSGVTLKPSTEESSNSWVSTATLMTWQMPVPSTSGVSGTPNNWVAVKNLMPGLTYYYRYTCDYFLNGATVTIWDQRQGDRSVYVPTMYETGLNKGVTWFYVVSDNWGDNPAAPQGLFGVPGNNEITLVWEIPAFRDNQIIDLEGGGYLVYYSTDSAYFKLYNSTSSLVTGNTVKLTNGLTNGVTYYIKIRSVDAYTFDEISPMASRYPNDATGEAEWYYSDTVSVVPGKMVEVTFSLDASALSPSTTEVFYIAGDVFDSWRYRIPLIRTASGRYSYRTVIPEHAAVRYKYLRENEYEYLSSDRRVIIDDIDNDSKKKIQDVFGVKTYPDPLPDDFIRILFTAVSSASLRIEWDAEPGALSKYQLRRSSYAASETSAYSEIVVSSSALSLGSNITDAGLMSYATYYYAVYEIASGSIVTEPFLVSPTGPGKRVPDFMVYSGFTKASLSPASYPAETGALKISFDSVSGANAYFVLYSTYEITAAMVSSTGSFRAVMDNVSYAKKMKNAGEVSLEGFPDTCPGYLLYVLSFFDGYEKCSLSSPEPVVFGVRAEETGMTISKGNLAFGSSTETARVSLAIPAYSAPSYPVIAAIRNSIELNYDNSGIREKIAAANAKTLSDSRLGRLSANSDLSSGKAMIYAFDAYHPSGRRLYAKKNAAGLPEEVNKKSFTIEIPYKDENTDGILDSSAGVEDVSVNDLRIYRLNETGNFWQYVSDSGINSVDTVRKVVYCNVDHLSVYAVFGAGQFASDLSDVAVYPNPFRPYDGDARTGTESSGIVFANLSENAKLFIYDLAGNLVRQIDENEVRASDQKGKYGWNARDSAGDYLSSGIYIYLIKDDKLTRNETARGKLAIIR